MLVIDGFIVSVITCEVSVVDVTVSPVFPNISSKSIFRLVVPCGSPHASVYVAVRSVHEPETLALFHAMLTEIHVRSSLPVNATVIVSQTFANHELLFDDVISTKFNVGLVPNEVKWVVSKLHS
jgi:hypothetical protein